MGPFRILAVLRNDRFLAGVDRESLLLTGIVEVCDLGGSFQDADLREADDAAFLGRELCEVHGLQVPGALVRDGLAGDEQDRSAYADGDRGCPYVHRLARIQFITHIEEDSAFREIHCERAVPLGKFHAAQGVQRADTALVQAHECRTGFAGLHGLAASEARVLHDGQLFSRSVLNPHRPFVMKQAHRRRRILFLRKGRARKHAHKKHQGAHACTEISEQAITFFHKRILQNAFCYTFIISQFRNALPSFFVHR